jgi:hypothetical protein
MTFYMFIMLLLLLLLLLQVSNSRLGSDVSIEASRIIHQPDTRFETKFTTTQDTNFSFLYIPPHRHHPLPLPICSSIFPPSLFLTKKVFPLHQNFRSLKPVFQPLILPLPHRIQDSKRMSLPRYTDKRYDA